MNYDELLHVAMNGKGYILATDLARHIGDGSACSMAHSHGWTPMCMAGQLMRYKTCAKGHASYVLPTVEAFTQLLLSSDFRFATWCDPKNKVKYDENTKSIISNPDFEGNV